MVDFMKITTRTKRGVIEIYPKFIIKKSTDLMIRGGDFYAVWDDCKKLWSTDEQDLIRIIDESLDEFYEKNHNNFDYPVQVLHMWDAETGIIDNWHKYCQKQLRDNFHILDEELVFSNTNTEKHNYASKKLSYPLESGPTPAYDRLIGTLYTPEERHKIEWAIGSVVSGYSKKLQKFLVLYGSGGTGKSTVLNIIEKLFSGYYSVFDAKALGSSNNSFALEAFKKNPLVAIQHDGDLSRIEDNTRLNSLVSHELMTVNEKFKSTYENRFNCFLFMATNKPVKITDAKSGLIRRLIDVSPSGNKLTKKEYDNVVEQINFELGKIASKCKDIFLENPNYYDDYIPIEMLGASNDFYNFILDSYNVFEKDDGTSLKSAWEMYKTYCDDAKVLYPLSQRAFKEELKNYFNEYFDRYYFEDGTRVRSYYKNFLSYKFEEPENNEKTYDSWIILKKQGSILDDILKKFPAQYANTAGVPTKAWDDTKTVLSDLDTRKIHYVRLPENHIVIDFDIKDKNGEKSLELNIKEASKWPQTYVELSKSGQGLHLHYIYTGDVSALSNLYDKNIEIKVFSGKSSLRRKLTKCNDIQINTISHGLPLREAKKNNVINKNIIDSEKGLRALIKKNLNKEIHSATKPSIDFIYKILEDAYNSGLHYDVTNMRNDILIFAANSTNNSDYCLQLVNKMHFNSDEASEFVDIDAPLVFYDIEVFPNLLLVNWKKRGKGNKVIRMINPKPSDIEELIKYRLVGFNCRRYDNHILYARLIGYDNSQIYELSKKIISGSRNAFFGEAYNLSYTDVYDFASEKKSLKKFEIELGIHHQELNLKWDEPVPEYLWPKVAEYCDNDVLATEAVFDARQGDWIARQILADVAGMSVNDTTNSLTTRIIFGKERHPELVYTDLSTGISSDNPNKVNEMNNFPTYRYIDGKNLFFYTQEGIDFYENDPIMKGASATDWIERGYAEDVGKGGYVYAEPGMYGYTVTFDVASMHPHSILAMNCFGKYTKNFKDLLDARIAIKHGDFETAKNMLNGKLAKYLDSPDNAKALAQALKIAINSVYGLTSANFDNPFRDVRNKNNIVALRGALVMISLREELKKIGAKVVHIKTDSIKIENPSKEIIDFVLDFGKKYGYTFEVEHVFDRIFLANDAVYIAKLSKDDPDDPGKWTATGTQFQVPYVFKKLFSKEPIEFDDLCETKAVTSSLYLKSDEDIHYVYDTSIGDWVKKPYSDDPEFVGKIGSFCPMIDNSGGGSLLRESKDKDGNVKYDSVAGTKGYKWMESEAVKVLGKEDQIDLKYYEKLAEEAVHAIENFGNFDWFASDRPYIDENGNTPSLPF